MDWFGLGIMLQARDNASDSILRVNQSLTTLSDNLGNTSSVARTEVESIQSSLNQLQSNIVTGMGMQQLGESAMALSGSIIQPIQDITKNVVSTGSQFEQWRMTLKALYKDAELAKEKLQWGMELAESTPFELPDVTQALISFKAMGVEADTMLKSSEGIEQSMLEFVGDLAALRPDVGLQGVMMGVRNLLGGDGGKSLKMRLDLPLEEILGREFSDSTDGLMQDIADLSSKVANGLMGELNGTWEQMISNLKDQSTKFFLGIADNGAFDKAKSTLKYLSDAINQIDDEKMKKIGTNIASAFEMIWKPVDFAFRKLTDFGMLIVDLLAENPAIAKFITTFIGLLGGITAVGGALLIFGGTFLIAVNGIKLFLVSLQGLSGSLAIIRGALSTTALAIGKFALVGGVIYALWKSDFGGIRSILQNFMNDIHTAFTYSTEIANMSVGDMMDALKQLDTTTFGGWLTLQLVRLKVLWTGLCDAWNDYTLSDENFQKLRELGLLPILEFILDFKMKAEAFFEGFKAGWKKVSDVIKTVLTTIGEAIEKVITKFFPLKEGVDDIKQSAEKIDLSVWEKFGSVIGVLAGVFATYKIGSKIFDIGKNVLNLGSNILSLPSKVATGFGAIKSMGETVYLKMLYAKDGVVSLATSIRNLPTKAVNLFKNAWSGVKTTMTGVKTAFMGAVTWVKNLANSSVVLTAKTWLLNASQTAMNVVQGIWNTLCAVNPMTWIIVGIVALIASLVLLYNKCDWFKNFVDSALQFLGDKLSWLWNSVLVPLGTYVGSIFMTLFTSAFDTIKAVVNPIIQGIADLVGGLQQIMGGLIDFIVGVFTGNWSQAWEGVKSIFSGIFDSLVAIAKAPINAIIGLINSAIEGMNSLSVTIPDWVPGIGGKSFGVDLPTIPQLNTGGYIKSEGISMLHPNEVVVNDPTTRKLNSFLDEQEKRKALLSGASASTNTVGATSNNNTQQVDNSVTFSEGAIQVTLTSGNEADVEKLFKEISKRLQREQSLRSTLNYKPSLG